MLKPKSGSKTVKNEQANYTIKLQTLTKQNQDKLHHISKLVNQASKATEEKKVRKTLNSYISDSEQTHGPLKAKVDKVDKIYTELADLELESEEIKAKGNIIAYKKQMVMHSQMIQRLHLFIMLCLTCFQM